MKILIVRGFAEEINLSSYNSQEIGLAKSLAKKGHICDIVYYTKNKNPWVQKLIIDECNINIYWYPAIKVFNNAIYTQMMKDEIIDKYDIIQTHEYNQFMTWYLCKNKKKPIVLYNGIYQDSRNILAKIINNKIPEILFKRTIIKNVDIAIGKSRLAEKYLKNKGFKNTNTIGVGLDIEKLNKNNSEDDNTKRLINDLKANLNDYKVLLYVGRLNDKAKNIEFLIDILQNILKKRKNYKLLMVGKCDSKTIERYLNYARVNGVENNIIHINGVPQTYLKDIYDISDIFVIPSKYEIFGMVIMESMYFKTPVITSINGGSTTIIDNDKDGIIVDEFNSRLWSEEIINTIENKGKYNSIVVNGHLKINKVFNWDSLSDNFIKKYEEILENKIKI